MQESWAICCKCECHNIHVNKHGSLCLEVFRIWSKKNSLLSVLWGTSGDKGYLHSISSSSPGSLTLTAPWVEKLWELCQAVVEQSNTSATGLVLKKGSLIFVFFTLDAAKLLLAAMRPLRANAGTMAQAPKSRDHGTMDFSSWKGKQGCSRLSVTGHIACQLLSTAVRWDESDKICFCVISWLCAPVP